MKRLFIIMTTIVFLLCVSMLCLADTIGYTGYHDFGQNTHLVYNAQYSDMFRTVDTGATKLEINATLIHIGTFVRGAEICNSDGTLIGAVPYSVSEEITQGDFLSTRSYSKTLSQSATYKAFIKPEDGLHLYINRATIWYD